MKPIGPYVAVQELSPPAPGVAAAESLVQTLRASDRLTGIPVLLHLLPRAQGLPEVPSSPHLLPVVDSGVDGGQAYLVTELPLQAHPARDPLLTARGALAALADLHDHGLAHGGVSAAQLWTLDSGVALAGAGLPWREDAGPAADLADLSLTLRELGALPDVLRLLEDRPGSLSARQVLVRLRSMSPVQNAGQNAGQNGGKSAGKRSQGRKPEVRPPPELAQRLTGPQRSGTQRSALQRLTSAQRPDSAQRPAFIPNAPDAGTLEPGTPTQMVGSDFSSVLAVRPATAPPNAAASAPDGTAAVSPAAPMPDAPRSQPETPQERRKRQNDKGRAQTLLDSQAAANRRTIRTSDHSEREAERAAAAAAEQAALGVPVPEPFQMDLGQLDTDHVETGHVDSERGDEAQTEQLPAAPRRPVVALAMAGVDADEAPQPLPGGTPPVPLIAPGDPVEAAPLGSGRPPARTLTPIRIGWDEDESWRVVRTASQTSQTWRLPRWMWPALAVLVLLGLGLLWLLRPERPAPVPAAVPASTVAPAMAPAAAPAPPAPAAPQPVAPSP
ncbi:hypothetical protein [Deinococcus arenicola]|uniref:Protein kinase domain-containing protein n=1 Tax=Deinococcus arenicola TaxID=2994950 RepID=A0ABU4DTB1_9DEIO|nr:hypothetical protein [Deinococcus sp. ZS9-10]MDV6375691.1 hypothetical protein [Deinococcus sp. ZS9-10]